MENANNHKCHLRRGLGLKLGNITTVWKCIHCGRSSPLKPRIPKHKYVYGIEMDKLESTNLKIAVNIEYNVQR